MSAEAKTKVVTFKLKAFAVWEKFLLLCGLLSKFAILFCIPQAHNAPLFLGGKFRKEQIVILCVGSETNGSIIVFSFSRPRETQYYFYDQQEW